MSGVGLRLELLEPRTRVELVTFPLPWGCPARPRLSPRAELHCGPTPYHGVALLTELRGLGLRRAGLPTARPVNNESASYCTGSPDVPSGIGIPIPDFTSGHRDYNGITAYDCVP